MFMKQYYEFFYIHWKIFTYREVSLMYVAVAEVTIKANSFRRVKCIFGLI